MSHMFKNCVKLSEILIYDDIINIDDKEFYIFEQFFIYNIDYNKDSNEYIYNNFYNDNDNIYSNCSEITKREERDTNHSNSTISDIKNNIIIYQYNYYSNMSEMFYNYKALSSISDIFKKNTDNVKDITYMFYNCSSLSFLPDISKWNIDNVEDIGCMFNNCSSLSSLPDISNIILIMSII